MKSCEECFSAKNQEGPYYFELATAGVKKQSVSEGETATASEICEGVDCETQGDKVRTDYSSKRKKSKRRTERTIKCPV